MGTAKVNGKEFWYEDRDTILDLRVTGGNVVINDKLIYHAEPTEDLEVDAYDLKHHVKFSNVGMPKVVSEEMGAIEPHETKPRSEVKQVGGVLAYNLVDDIGRESRNLQRRTIRKGMNTVMDGALAALFGKKRGKK